MPYKSDAQRRYFHWAEGQGKMPKKMVSEFDQASKGADLPEHLYDGGDIADYPDGIGSEGENVSSGEPHMSSDYVEEHPLPYMDDDNEMQDVMRASHGGRVQPKRVPQGYAHGGFAKALASRRGRY